MKVALCIPCYGDPKAKFMQSILSMVTHTLQADLRDGEGERINLQMETFIVTSSMLVENRHRLVGEALAWGADYMLWMDADHVFPHDAFCRLWAHNLPVVGANYPRRAIPTAPTAAYYEGEEVRQLYTTLEKAEAGEVEPCAHLGFGLCLINMKIFDALQAHAEKEGDGNFLPLFEMSATVGKQGTMGEDVFFFRKLRAAGITPFIDHGLSWEVGHIHEMILTNAHAVTQKEKWAQSRAATGEKFAKAIEAAEA